jgi:Transcriptional regulator, AbiEi antitoxin, Type IV TA system
MQEQEILMQGKAAIRECLDRVPFVKIRDEDFPPFSPTRRPDFLLRIESSTGQYTLVVEAKSSGQPRIALQAIDQLKAYEQRLPNPYSVFLAPYISESSAKLCEEEGIGYIDLAGNCRLSFGQIYIEQRGKANPYSEKRALRSLYSPKAERILRVLLIARQSSWKVEELAQAADVSLGLVSKVKKLLEDREWLDSQAAGMKLLNPETALVEWAQNYSYTKHQSSGYYAFTSGAELEEQVTDAAERCGLRIAFTGFSAAVRYAPAVRYQRSMVFCNGAASCIAQELDLKQVPSGANLVITTPYDDGVFYASEERGGIPVVSPVQAYIDLMKQAARGEEAAEAILEEVIRSRW